MTRAALFAGFVRSRRRRFRRLLSGYIFDDVVLNVAIRGVDIILGLFFVQCSRV
jgi:hypothetical protein